MSVNPEKNAKFIRFTVLVIYILDHVRRTLRDGNVVSGLPLFSSNLQSVCEQNIQKHIVTLKRGIYVDIGKSIFTFVGISLSLSSY